MDMPYWDLDPVWRRKELPDIQCLYLCRSFKAWEFFTDVLGIRTHGREGEELWIRNH
jgi:hypothetical protein